MFKYKLNREFTTIMEIEKMEKELKFQMVLRKKVQYSIVDERRGEETQ